MSSATIAAIVTAAMWPVEPRATPATRVATARRRAAARSDAARPLGCWFTKEDLR
jgi:hypothetical protein